MVPLRCCFSQSNLFSLCLTLFLLLSTVSASEAWSQRKPETAERMFADAYKVYAAQLYDQAVVRFDTFRRTYPDHESAAEAMYYQAAAALAAGHTDQAIHLFTDFQRRFPAHPLGFESRLALGQYFYQSQDYNRALETLRMVVEDDPPGELAAKALYWMGESAHHLGRPDEAISYYQTAADRYQYTETAPIALYAVAYSRLEQQEYQEAARGFELLAARHPHTPYARTIGIALAEVYYEIGDYRRVVDEIKRRQSQLDPETKSRATFLMAESYNQLRDSENAIVYYRRITDEGPESRYYRRALYGLGWNYFASDAFQWAADNFAGARGDTLDELGMRATYYEAASRKLSDEPVPAIGLFEAVSQDWPDSPLAEHALYEKGLIQYELRRWQDAYDSFSQLIRSYPQTPLLGDALRQRGYTAIALSDFDQAFRDFDQAVALDAAPQALIDEILFQKAWLLYRTDDFQASSKAFMDLAENNADTPTKGEAIFWAGESYFQLNQFDQASRLFRQYLREYRNGPNVDAAHYALGWTYFKQGRYQQAIDEFNAFLGDYQEEGGFVPYLTDARLRLADSYYALKRYNEAVRMYQKVADAGEDYAQYQIAQAYYNAGDAYEAITAFQDLLESSPDTNWREEALYTLGYIFFQNQDYEESISQYQTLIQRYPSDPLAAKAQYGIGDAHFNANRMDEAVAAYIRVLERYPNSPFVGDAAAGIQYAFIGLDDPDRADDIIEDFERRNPNSPVVAELRFRQAEVKFQSGQTADSFSDFRDFVRNYGNSPLISNAYYYLGTIYATEGDYSNAESTLRRVMDRYPQSTRRTDAALDLGEMLLHQDRHREALDVYQELEQMQSSDPTIVAHARYGQGLSLLGLGRAREAETLLQHAIESNPDSPDSIPATLGLAKVYEQSGRIGDAALLYRQVVDRSQEETGAEALYHLGALILSQGDARGAITELSRLPVLFAGFPDWLAQGLLLQAQAFRSLGQTGDASQLYDRIIAEFGGTQYADRAAQEKANL